MSESRPKGRPGRPVDFDTVRRCQAVNLLIFDGFSKSVAVSLVAAAELWPDRAIQPGQQDPYEYLSQFRADSSTKAQLESRADVVKKAHDRFRQGYSDVYGGPWSKKNRPDHEGFQWCHCADRSSSHRHCDYCAEVLDGLDGSGSGYGSEVTVALLPRDPGMIVCNSVCYAGWVARLGDESR
jgi:hypothetical protein